MAASGYPVILKSLLSFITGDGTYANMRQSFITSDVDLSTDRTIKGADGFAHSITIANATASAVTAVLYHGATASGTRFSTITVPANSTANAIIDGEFSGGLTIASLSSASVRATVSYR